MSITKYLVPFLLGVIVGLVLPAFIASFLR